MNSKMGSGMACTTGIGEVAAKVEGEFTLKIASGGGMTNIRNHVFGGCSPFMKVKVPFQGIVRGCSSNSWGQCIWVGHGGDAIKCYVEDGSIIRTTS